MTFLLEHFSTSACVHMAELLRLLILLLVTADMVSFQMCFFFCAEMSLFIPRLSASARGKPSCLKVIFVKIIYENFSIFSLGTLTKKHPQTSAVVAAGVHLY